MLWNDSSIFDDEHDKKKSYIKSKSIQQFLQFEIHFLRRRVKLFEDVLKIKQIFFYCRVNIELFSDEMKVIVSDIHKKIIFCNRSSPMRKKNLFQKHRVLKITRNEIRRKKKLKQKKIIEIALPYKWTFN